MNSDDAVLDAIFNPGNPINLEGIFLPDCKKLPISDGLLMQLKQHEQDGLAFAEQEDFASAINSFTKAIKLYPEYASAFNNRAQAYRLAGRNEDAMRDLELAIKFGQDFPSTLRQAYTQRAALHRKNGDFKAAERDLELGAQFGNPVAKGLVKENPYAKLYAI
jgi:tetratricopeptide (TPR) repeat protein